MNFAVALSLLAFLAAAPAGKESAVENPVFTQLLAEGVKMSDDKSYKLRPPIMPDELDAAGQLAAVAKLSDARNSVKDILRNDYFAPVVTKVRNAKPQRGEEPAIRTIDVWFVAHGDWGTLVSKDFLESTTAAENGKSRVVLKSGGLTEKEMRKRNLTAATVPEKGTVPFSLTRKLGQSPSEQRFLYTTFWLFERVQVSATRFSMLTRGKNSVLAAGKIDPRFDKDSDYPNEWRPLVRDVQANVKPGRAHPFTHAGGYAKITRLKDTADAVFIEFHLIYEEPYGWFDGASLVRQKIPVMVQEKVRTFRRKLAMTTEEKAKKK
jgi:hypothetical protein